MVPTDREAENMEIFANHAHIYQDDVMKNGSIDDLKKVMDICGIQKSVAFAPLRPDYRNEGVHQK